MIRRRILLGVLLAVLFGIGWGAGRGRASGDLYSNLDTFIEVLHAVQTSYVDEVQPRPLIEGGLRGMLRELDPHSEYLTPSEYEGLRNQLDESFDGVGVQVDMHEGYPVVVAPLEDSPAWDAGLLPGDVITKIDGHLVFGLGLPEIGAKLRGKPGTRVTVTVIRPGDDDDRDVTIERGRITSRGVPYAFVMPQGIGYVRLSRFTERAGEELAAAFDTLRAGGARSLVLDLRGNPGGLVEQAVAVVQSLVPEGSLIVYTKGRIASASKRWTAAKTKPAPAWPVAVLVDGGSASASEITAGALQDLDRALVVGQNSFGKGTVQDVFPLRNREGALKLTTAYYYTASGRSLQRPKPASGDEDEEDDAPGDTSAVDSAPARPVFHTASGRTVHGGGGVEPDIEVKADSLVLLARRIEERRIAVRFAGAHPGVSAGDAGTWGAFVAFARTQGVSGADADFDAVRAPMERVLRREITRRASGAAAAAKVGLAEDPVYLRAADVLARSRVPKDVFAVASGRSPAVAPARKVR